MADSDHSKTPLRRLSVAIVAWQALPAILPDVGRNVGGLETGAWRLAKDLAQHRDIDSQIIVRSPGKTTPDTLDQVTVSANLDRREYVRREFAACIDWHDRIRIHRLSPKLLWQIPYLAFTWPWRAHDPEAMKPDPRLSQYHPDVWIALGTSRESAGVVATAIDQQKPSLLMIQANVDLDPSYVAHPSRRNAYGELGEHCLFAIQHATQVVCQTKMQQQLLREHFGREGIRLNNATDPGPWRQAVKQPGDYVLWLGRYDRFHKRPALAIEIARLCPQIPFRMIVNESDEEVRREILADLPPNVELSDYVPFDQLPQVFGSARIFLSTGSAQYEGFPTVLLHAAAAQKPIVSLDDFDDFIADSQSGIVCRENPKRAAEAIQEYWDRPEDHDASHANNFLQKHHTSESVTKRLVELLQSLSAVHPHAND